MSAIEDVWRQSGVIRNTEGIGIMKAFHGSQDLKDAVLEALSRGCDGTVIYEGCDQPLMGDRLFDQAMI